MCTTKPNVAFFPAHPAQLWFMYAISNSMKSQINIIWVLRDKDILIKLADKLGITYQIVSKAKTGMLGNAAELAINIFRCLNITKTNNIDLWLTKYGAGNIAAKLCGKKSIAFNDDDIDIVPYIAATSYPFADRIVAPRWVRMGRYDKKTVRHDGIHELIHINQEFRTKIDSETQSDHRLKTPYILIRLSALTAHHDRGIKGLSEKLLASLINEFQHNYKFIITSEKDLPSNLKQYQYSAEINDIHRIIAGASCFITDSLSMAKEAAVLATPTIRFSDFSDQISTFQELQKYQLIFNHEPSDIQIGIQTIKRILKQEKQGIFKQRSELMTQTMTSPLAFFSKTILELLFNKDKTQR